MKVRRRRSGRSRWTRGYGVWVRDVFAFSGSPGRVGGSLIAVQDAFVLCSTATERKKLRKLGPSPLIARFIDEDGEHVDFAGIIPEHELDLLGPLAAAAATRAPASAADSGRPGRDDEKSGSAPAESGEIMADRPAADGETQQPRRSCGRCRYEWATTSTRQSSKRRSRQNRRLCGSTRHPVRAGPRGEPVATNACVAAPSLRRRPDREEAPPRLTVPLTPARRDATRCADCG